jgi:hypothetical protein
MYREVAGSLQPKIGMRLFPGTLNILLDYPYSLTPDVIRLGEGGIRRNGFGEPHTLPHLRTTGVPVANRCQ